MDSSALSVPVLSNPSMSKTLGFGTGAVSPSTAITGDVPEVIPRSAAHDGFEEGLATVAAMMAAV